MLFWSSSFAKVDAPVTVNDVDIQIILELKTVLKNIILYVLKILKGFFWDTLYDLLITGHFFGF